MTRGLFLTLDGLDGTGKSTQCRLLADWLRSQGQTVVTCADPGGTAVGDMLREVLLHRRQQMAPACEMFLFMASRAQLVAEVIRPALEAGQVVVCDRFLLANVVYQGYAGGLDPDEVWRVGRLSTGGLEPDLTLLLDLSPEQAKARRTGPTDRIEGRGPVYHARVRQGFLAEAERRPECIRVINADRPPLAVQESIRREVEPLLATALAR
jgi:dTMP kinase